ncbi:DNA-3-methyladenine glycosylase [Caloramator mitchellensis]|uniref:DNA-3-methyladenine glycosylase II n=1 Tax=Caloramator mitchellensis TaxID=908809 RepID=A0A0R3K307_CALMK|nr:DNA-3-methyladenine glycosylase [Caloramator mitchellensis]KRQ86703.1 DNA-3-methyladenine glycosylase [Caloramator mitchellensis]
MDKIILSSNDSIVKKIANKDKKFKELVKMVGDIEITLEKNYFSSLVQAIVGQQLSMKAAETIWNRVMSLLGEVNYENILKVSDEDLRNVGLSRSKVVYVKDLSQKVKDKIVNINEIDKLGDEEIINELIKVKGIGRWTAEMFLIFSLGRMDVFSIQDLGLKKSVQWLYNLIELPSNDYLRELSDKFKPYRTILSLYLWGAINKSIIK